MFEEGPHRYVWRGRELPSVSQLIAPLVDLSGIPPEALEAKRTLGSYVHKACEYDDAGRLDWSQLDYRLKGYVAAWRAYRSQVGFDPVVIEQPLAHPTLGYAGTPDRAGMLDPRASTIPGGFSRRRWLLDLKSCVSIYPWTGVQLAGYRRLLEAHGVLVDALGALQLFPDGRFKLHPLMEPDDDRAFMACLSLFNWRRKHV